MRDENCHRREALAAAASTVVAALMGGTAFGQSRDEKNFFQGRPKGFKAGNPAAFYLWYEKARWHLWTTTAGKLHRFEGRITVKGGNFKGVFGANGETKGKIVDKFIWKNDKLQFVFDTKGGEDGISFTVDDDAKEIEFTLVVDGKSSSQHVHVGKQNQHPGSIPFTLPPKPMG